MHLQPEKEQDRESEDIYLKTNEEVAVDTMKKLKEIKKQVKVLAKTNEFDFEDDDYQSAAEGSLKDEDQSNVDDDELTSDDDDDQLFDDFGQPKRKERCRACDEAFGTGKNESGIDDHIDKTLASAGNSMELDAIIRTIYDHVEKERRRYNRQVTDPKDHIEVWSKAMIKKHLCIHMVRLDMQIKAQHELNKATEELILKQIKTVDPETGNVIVNYKAVDALLKVHKATKDNTRLNPEASFTYVSEHAPKRTRVKRAIDSAPAS